MTTHIQVELQIACDETELPSPANFQQWADLAVDPQHADKELCIRLVNPDESQQLNKTYRQKDKPTNVLSFAYEEDELLGDIVICADIVAEEAKQQHKPLMAHWAHITLHGLLHLQGYDHQTDEQADAMENLEIKLLKQLGYDNPYQV